MSDVKFQCPFVYANGRRCEGHVHGIRAYGPRSMNALTVKKIRFWCSEKDDHAGTNRGWAAKERMEFYPDQVHPDLKERVSMLFDRGIYEANLLN